MSATVTYHDLPPMVGPWAEPFTEQLSAQAGMQEHTWAHFQDPQAQTEVWSPSTSTAAASFHPPPLLHPGKKRFQLPARFMPPSHSGPEELCLVCGDKASGYHYNALTCEGCKGFFRRSITKKSRYMCKYGNNCDIDMYMRRKCQYCRLRKCFGIGMRQELVIPEDQCRKKRESKQRMRSAEMERVSSSPQQVTSTESLSPCPPPQQGLSPEQQELIQRLGHFQDSFEQPEDGFRSPTGAHDIKGLLTTAIQLIVDFVKVIPGFRNLCREDQISLVNAGVFEALILRLSRRYDPRTDCLVLGAWGYTRDTCRAASGMGSATDAVFDFARGMSKLRVDSPEYALLTAIAVFSDRPNLKEAKKVEEIQEVYTSALQGYIDSHRPKLRTMFARLLMKLTDLRSLGSSHSDCLATFHTNECIQQAFALNPPEMLTVKQEDFGLQQEMVYPPPLTAAPGHPPPPPLVKQEIPVEAGYNTGYFLG